MVELKTETMVNSPTGSRRKRRKGKKVRAFFRTVWTSLKSTSIHHDPNRVVYFQPQPDLKDRKLIHVSSPVRNKPRLDAYPELVCLPGQVCEDLKSPCGSGIFRSEQTANTDPVVPELECLPGQVYEEDLEQTPDTDPELVCEDLESLCVPGFSMIEQTPHADPVVPELVCLPGQVCEDLKSPCGSGIFRSEQTANTDPVVPELECLPGQVYEEDLEQTPDTDPELVCEDLESLCVPGFSRIEQTPHADPVVPELVCLPGQVCGDLESLRVCYFSRIKQTPDVDPSDSELSPASLPSTSDLDDGSRRKRRKGKKVRAFFRTVWTSLKSTSIHHDPNRVVYFQPQPDLKDRKLIHVSSPVRNKPRLDAYPELVCLPGQVCEDLKSPCGSGIFRSEQTANTDPVVPELECLPGQVYEEDLEQTPDTDPELVCEDLESLCVPGFSRIEQTPHADPVVPELVCLPGQVCGDLESLRVCCFSRIKQTPDVDPSDSELSPASLPSTSDLDDAKPREKKGLCGFLRSVWKALKRHFGCCCHCSAVNVVEPFVPPPDLDPEPDPDHSAVKHNNEFFASLYKVGKRIGSGSFGCVYEGIRIFDGKNIAIKMLRKFNNNRYLAIPGHPEPLITEVALLLMMRQEPISPYVIQLHEWFEHLKKFTLVMEYPEPCESLQDLMSRNPKLDEPTARVIMRQAVLAVQHCIEHGVFHNDGHTGNFLLKKNTLELKLIDFGCGQLLSSDGYESEVYLGAKDYCPPEVYTDTRFHAVPTNVWGLGVLLYEMTNACPPFHNEIEITQDKVTFVNSNLSIEMPKLLSSMGKLGKCREAKEQSSQEQLAYLAYRKLNAVIQKFPGTTRGQLLFKVTELRTSKNLNKLKK